jgi:signal transduction histidine kinase
MSQQDTKPSILAIDDDPANLKLLSHLLGEAGFDVRTVLDGDAGLRSALRLPPDLVLLDVKMPAVDGYTVCQQFKARRALADIPIIFVSAAEETMDKVKAFRVGAVDYIVRPFEVDEVLARVNTQIRLYHTYRQAEELAALRERQRLARELHDVINQTLFSINLTAETALRLHTQDGDMTLDRLREIRQLAQEAMVEMRVLMHELRPELLHAARLDELLNAIARTLTANTDLELKIDTARPTAPSPEVQIAYYRIAQEALTNIIRHAHARHAWLTLIEDADCLRLMISDDGGGFDAGALRSGHYGLANIRAHAAAIGAACSIVSAPGHGTTITVVWHKEPQDER